MANSDLRTNFNACVTLSKTSLHKRGQANGNEHQVAAVTLSGGGGYDPNDRYVPDPIWQAMSKDERDKVLLHPRLPGV